MPYRLLGGDEVRALGAVLPDGWTALHVADAGVVFADRARHAFLESAGVDVETNRRIDSVDELDADAVVVTTDGDNSNIVIGQMAQKQFDVSSVVVRVLDPARAEFYSSRGLNVVCPTSSAIASLTEAVRTAEGALR